MVALVGDIAQLGLGPIDRPRASINTTQQRIPTLPTPTTLAHRRVEVSLHLVDAAGCTDMRYQNAIFHLPFAA